MLEFQKKIYCCLFTREKAILLSSNWNCAQRLIGIRKAISKPLTTASNKSLKKLKSIYFSS